MKRNNSNHTKRAELRLQDMIPDGRRQVGESASAEAHYVLRRAVICAFLWETKRRASTTLH